VLVSDDCEYEVAAGGTARGAFEHCPRMWQWIQEHPGQSPSTPEDWGIICGELHANSNENGCFNALGQTSADKTVLGEQMISAEMDSSLQYSIVAACACPASQSFVAACEGALLQGSNTDMGACLVMQPELGCIFKQAPHSVVIMNQCIELQPKVVIHFQASSTFSSHHEPMYRVAAQGRACDVCGV